MRDVAYIALGSNLGDRHGYLSRARAALAALPDSRLIAESMIEETAPLAAADQPAFLNQMVALETALAPHDLLNRLLAIEAREGRARGPRWGPRTLDLDIVSFERQTVHDATLVVPHPELPNRDFWQRELAELHDARSPSMSESRSEVALPGWALVAGKRRDHIMRVTTLLIHWADAMRVGADERRAWIDAGLFHDALKDAPVEDLQRLAGDAIREPELLHGPAAASYLEQHGESRPGLLTAVRYHSIGYLDWDRTGRALYMADFLEPGRRFSRRDRAFLAAHVPHDFDGVFTQVVRARLEWSLHEGHSLFPDTVALWNALR